MTSFDFESLLGIFEKELFKIFEVIYMYVYRFKPAIKNFAILVEKGTFRSGIYVIKKPFLRIRRHSKVIRQIQQYKEIN